MNINELSGALSATLKSSFSPGKYYPIILNYGWKITIIHTLLLQIALSAIVIFLTMFIAPYLPESADMDSILNLLLSLVAVSPLVLLLPSMLLAIFMYALNCHGSLLSYFRLSICYALKMVVIFIAISFVFGFLYSFLKVDHKILSSLSLLQFFPLIIYSVNALKIAYNTTIFKSLLAHTILLAIFVIFGPG